MTAELDCYQILSINPDATLAEIRAAYRRKAKECHPDRGGTHEQMIAVIAAWEILADPQTRAVYDSVRATRASADARRRWESVSREASVRAATTARNYGRTWQEFSTWVDTASAEVEATASGRAAAGVTVGLLLGGVLGGIVGSAMAIGIWPGLVVGSVAGGVGGIVAGNSGRSKAKPTRGK